jgi:hypothetical protein
VPETLDAARALFAAAGYGEEAVLIDYVLERVERAPAVANRFVIPVSIDDLDANGLLGEDYPQTCWERAVETLMAGKQTVEGMAVASDEGIEAVLLYRTERAAASSAPSPSTVPSTRVLSLRCFVEDDGARVKLLLSRLPLRDAEPVCFPKVHPSELSPEFIQALGFRAAARYRLCAASARGTQRS